MICDIAIAETLEAGNAGNAGNMLCRMRMLWVIMQSHDYLPMRECDKSESSS